MLSEYSGMIPIQLLFYCQIGERLTVMNNQCQKLRETGSKKTHSEGRTSKPTAVGLAKLIQLFVIIF